MSIPKADRPTDAYARQRDEEIRRLPAGRPHLIMQNLAKAIRRANGLRARRS